MSTYQKRWWTLTRGALVFSGLTHDPHETTNHLIQNTQRRASSGLLINVIKVDKHPSGWEYVPRALMGTDSGCFGSVDRVCSNSIRSSAVSPMPMMPPQHTDKPALRTALRVLRRSSYVRVVMICAHTNSVRQSPTRMRIKSALFSPCFSSILGVMHSKKKTSIYEYSARLAATNMRIKNTCLV